MVSESASGQFSVTSLSKSDAMLQQPFNSPPNPGLSGCYSCRPTCTNGSTAGTIFSARDFSGTVDLYDVVARAYDVKGCVLDLDASTLVLIAPPALFVFIPTLSRSLAAIPKPEG